VTELSVRGFARAVLDDDDHPSHFRSRQAIAATLAAGREMKQFRYPPIDIMEGEPLVRLSISDEVHDECVRALSCLASAALAAVLSQCPDQQTSKVRMLAASIEEGKQHAQGNMGPFYTSFFNVFNYDHGCLNAHQDRCLITAVCAHAIREDDADEDGTSSKVKEARLWVQGVDESWTDVDAQLLGSSSSSSSSFSATLQSAALPSPPLPRSLSPPSQYTPPHKPLEVAFLVGQDLASALADAGLLPSVAAAEHCVRVDPCGDAISRAHHRCDPDATAPPGSHRHRTSAALVLSHPEF
jgi:hypothetical protein